MLPIPSGSSFSEWAEAWLISIAPEIRSIENDPNKVRDRNEKFSAFLPTLTSILAVYGEHIDKLRADFVRNNPQGDKEGPQAYGKRVDAAVAEYERMYDFVQALHKDISTRLSVAQTFIRTLTEQVRHGV